MKPKVKKRRCLEKAKGCHIDYVPWTAHPQRQAVCTNPACLFQKSDKNRAKAEARKVKVERQQTAAQKEALKPLSKLLAEVQTYCNRHVLLQHKGKPCYTCGSNPERFEAGHFIPVGRGPNWHIRFHHFNIRPQCHKCNNYEGGRPVEFRKNLIKEIGLGAVEYLENAPQSAFTREDAIEIKAHFMAECIRLKNEL